MIRHTSNGLTYYSFESFDKTQVDAAVFTRKGGISPSPWDSLNVGGSVGDLREHVTENRIRSFKSIGKDPESVYDVWQVHSNTIVLVDHPKPFNSLYEKADGMLTNHKDVTLFMRFADCVPVLLYDPVQKVIGLVHSGWVGTVNQIARDAVKRMEECYGCISSNIVAGIGPSICCEHYAVGADVVEKVNQSFHEDASRLLVDREGVPHFDLWKANELILRQSGVQQIEISGQCTACHPEDWYSHRGEKGKTGRFGVLFALK